MPKLDLDAIPQTNHTGYPTEYAQEVAGRFYRRIAPETGLTDFGVSHVTLMPGAWSSQRHWHEDEDEFVVILSGEAILIDEDGRTPMAAGDMAAFPKNDGNGHHLVNESDTDCMFVVVGRPAAGACHYPDVDMHIFGDGAGFRRKDGSAFP
ncbi:transcriptional regulator [Sphingobium sp. SCG-1]|uniref:cupin domain-containing protein n=1 Tax=Sphingobium sp. SCG-1 TaxID=2072936 RepID=UPI000CD6C06A|nr:cupin domain-containing protein [Sphingobium sp. SCG-1]AUW59792.1 transcriptional regulator [Sphingobium sp. SCG-1]